MPKRTRVLITGATGFAGRHLIARLRSLGAPPGGPQFEIVGTCFPERPEGCDPFLSAAAGVHLVHQDLRDAAGVETLVRDARPERIFHLAALSQVRASWNKRRETIESNLLGTFNLFEAVRTAAPAGRVLFVSSSDVYGQVRSRRKPFRERERNGAASPYAFTKLGGELLAELYARADGLALVIARPFSHTGPGQSADFVCSDWARQIALIEKGAAPVLRVGNLAVRRDYSDVRDIVRAYTLLLERGAPGEAYNIGSGRAPSLREILRTIIGISGLKIRVEVDPGRLRRVDIPYLAGDLDKIRRRTGWKPLIPLDRTLRDLLDEWRWRVSNPGP